MPLISLIAAVARNGTVGRDNAMPWHLPADLRYFKSVTSGHPVVMGRKTFDSIGRPLPNRHNIVITRQIDWQVEGITVVHSLEEALAAAGPADEIFIMGGGQIYAQALPLADRLYLTEIDADFEGDAFFPAWPREQFREQARQEQQGESFSYRHMVYERC
ncbi:dihydrofolate reductase [Chitinimonas lacunae]|uniref:Dihydrofolate reductase n=1 Tax=Chitinimonas lacunae TaxID=1963018 RepID=A0ABV8MPV0_9NEIS